MKSSTKSEKPTPRAAVALGILLAVPVALALGGCAEVCDVVDCTQGEGGAGAGDGSGGSATTTSSAGGEAGAPPAGQGGSGGAPPTPTCEPEEGSPVGDDCGVYVDRFAPPGGDGSRAAPFSSMQPAVDAAALVSRRVYVCSTASIDEAVVVPAGTSLFGGIDCSAWEWRLGERTDWTAPTDTIPIHVMAGNDAVRIAGFDIVAAPASQGSGASSIAALAEAGVQLVLERASLTAGQGGTGTPGTTGSDGGNGTNAVNATAGMGGCGASNAGGKGGACSGGTCSSGDPGLPAGTGGTSGNTSLACDAGGSGGDAPLVTTVAAEGAAGGGGTLDSTGFLPAVGEPGASGANGGGGGGGAAKSSGQFLFSGGGGGGGGCGGQGGAGGGGGGASFALVLVGATATFSDVALTSSRGGDAGAPGEGGTGGTAGSGTVTNTISCKGGNGAGGAAGARGGGGNGGPSALVAYKNTSAPQLAAIVDPQAALREGGAGSGNAGAGAAAAALELP